MERTALPLPPEIWAATPCADQALLLALQERVRELGARLGQHSANSSRPPSFDPSQALVRPKAPPPGRKRGGQPGHRGVCRGLLPVEQVDEIVAVVDQTDAQTAMNLAVAAGRQPAGPRPAGCS